MPAVSVHLCLWRTCLLALLTSSVMQSTHTISAGLFGATCGLAFSICSANRNVYRNYFSIIEGAYISVVQARHSLRKQRIMLYSRSAACRLKLRFLLRHGR